MPPLQYSSCQVGWDEQPPSPVCTADYPWSLSPTPSAPATSSPSPPPPTWPASHDRHTLTQTARETVLVQPNHTHPCLLWLLRRNVPPTPLISTMPLPSPSTIHVARDCPCPTQPSPSLPAVAAAQERPTHTLDIHHVLALALHHPPGLQVMIATPSPRATTRPQYCNNEWDSADSPTGQSKWAAGGWGLVMRGWESERRSVHTGGIVQSPDCRGLTAMALLQWLSCSDLIEVALLLWNYSGGLTAVALVQWASHTGCLC